MKATARFSVSAGSHDKSILRGKWASGVIAGRPIAIFCLIGQFKGRKEQDLIEVPAEVDGISAWNPTNRARELAYKMVGWQSVTGTPGEAAFADCLADLLRQMSYFREHPENLVLVDSHGDPMSRSVVAIVRGSGARAVALAGHFDTADIVNYHDLAPLACQPDALCQALIDDLTSRPLSAQEALALVDLQSGAFVPGRAMLDMKSGLAAGIAVLERFAEDPDRSGNLILLATPDEEQESRGMRSLRDGLPSLMQAFGLDIVAGINLDATSDQGDGALGRSVYAGTIGKLLPFALIIGQSSHASYPFEGVSAQLVGAEILRAIEGRASLADPLAADPTPPPICLEARSLRDGYEVTTPERFWIAFNWLFHGQSAADVFAGFRAEVEAASTRAMDHFRDQAAAFSKVGNGLPVEIAPMRILTVADVTARALAADPEAATRLNALIESMGKLDNPLALSRQVTEWLIDTARLTGPAIVIGFAGLHYPPTRLDPAAPKDARLLQAVDAAIASVADDHANRVKLRPIFHGISDMSFLGQPASAMTPDIAANTPVPRLRDAAGADALKFPVVNIGPWGREFHQRLERLHADYGFRILPQVIDRIARFVLGR